MASNMYVICEGGGFYIVDPSVTPDRVPEGVLADDACLKAILITHCHYDHIAAVEEWLRRWPEAPVFLSRKDRPFLNDPDANCSSFISGDRIYSIGTVDFDKVKELPESFTISLIETPGHTPGSVSFLVRDRNSGEKALLSGDFLFRGSIGRTDFPGGSYEQMMDSLERIMDLPDDLPVLPGHGPDSTIGFEKRSNPYFIY
ncbi:Glyoxylase, beta-lactamase superfamily II [Ruminococcaceae bacterium YRB3002]|nr:Glyoxylase, beta-lactamase superfamily II [Ruminococcaceae bacterium YRB3002]